MKYNWSYDDIENELAKLTILSKKELDLVKRSYYLRVIDQVRCLLVNNKDIIITNNQKMNGIINSFNYYRRYYALIDWYNLILDGYAKKTEQIVKWYDAIEEPEQFDYEYITHEDALTMNYDFFHNIDEEFSKYFSILYKDRYKSIKFSKDDYLLERDQSDGHCIFIDVVNKNFIKVNDTVGLSKVVNLSHECGHAVANLFMQDIYDIHDDFLTELASQFFELAFQTDIGENIDPFENTLLQFEKMNFYNYIANSLLFHQELIESWQNNGYNVSPLFYRYLKNKYQLTRETVKESLNISIESDGPYIISYMVALELLHIYKDNKKEALNILKRILVKSKTCDSLDIISQFIPNFTYFNVEIGQLHDKITKEFVKKKIMK